MPFWNVTLRIVGRATLEVEAETEREAIKEAKDRCTIDDFDDWEPDWSNSGHHAECIDCEEEEDFDEDEEFDEDE